MNFDLGNGLVKGEMRRMTSPFETKIGLGGFVMLQLMVGDQVCLINKDIESTEGRIFVAPEGLINIGINLFVSIPATCVMTEFEIAQAEGK